MTPIPHALSVRKAGAPQHPFFSEAERKLTPPTVLWEPPITPRVPRNNPERAADASADD